MDAENRLVYASAEGKQVENVSAVAPDDDVAVLLDTLLIEAVYLSDGTRLMVTADERNPGRVAALERH